MTLFQRFKRLSFWNKLGVVASIVGILAFILTLITLPIFERSKPHPHFILSLQIGDSPESQLILTNDFLFDRQITKVGDLPKGRIRLNSLVNGCILIPVQEGESNIIFNFIVENDSQVKVDDLELSVGFPKYWKCGVDPAKWHSADVALAIPGWKIETTNVQFFVAQSPWPLFPSDTLTFPAITNPCTVEYNGSSFKSGIVDVSLRATDFENMLAANIVFIPASSNFFKPFATYGKIESDGQLHLLITQEEFEESQR